MPLFLNVCNPDHSKKNQKSRVSNPKKLGLGLTKYSGFKLQKIGVRIDKIFGLA